MSILSSFFGSSAAATTATKTVSTSSSTGSLGAITPAGVANPTGTGGLTSIVDAATTNIVNLLFLVGGSLAVIYLLWSGVQYIMAAGNVDKAKAARQSIINAIIGIIIMMAAFFIIRIAVSVGTLASKIDTAGAVPAPAAAPAAPVKKPTTTKSTGSNSTGTKSTTNSSGNQNATSETSSTGDNTLCADGSAPSPDGVCP